MSDWVPSAKDEFNWILYVFECASVFVESNEHLWVFNQIETFVVMEKCYRNAAIRNMIV